MAVVTNSYNPPFIVEGPADTYVDIGSPPSAIPPTAGTNVWSSGGTYQLDAKGQPTDNSTIGGIATYTLGGSQTSYVAGDVISVTQTGTSLTAYIQVLTVSAGAIVTSALLQAGLGYSTASGLATVAVTGSGSGATVTISTIVSGFHIGLSDGPVVLSMTPKFHEIRADQHAGPVDAAFTSLETEIDFIVKEALLSNLAKFFSSTIGTYTNVPSGASTGIGSNPAADYLQIGSVSTDAVLFHTLLLVSPDRANLGHFYVVNAYKTMLKSAVATTFKRDTETLWKLKFGCFADVTRVLGDMVCQIVKV